MAAHKKAPPVSFDPELDRRMMAAALRLGRRNLGQTRPNPAIGAIIVGTEGATSPIVIGRGWTAIGGRPHAEREALKEAGKAAKGATAYVTLEPCAHKSGRNLSCAEALIAAGVARVVTTMADPDPRTNGAGHKMLEDAGIAVTTGVLAAEAAQAHAGFISRVTRGRPYVTLKLAVSADGMIGRRGGERMIISGRPAFEAVQAMRAESDAVMVGIGTVLIDDPQLTVRLRGLSRRSPVRVILDAAARTPPSAKLFEAKDVPLIIVVGPDASEENKAVLKVKGATIIEVGAASGGVDLRQALEALAADGTTRLLVEGGSEIASSVVTEDLADEVILFRAPVVVGPDGVRALGNSALSAIERSPRYRQVESAVIGEDQMRRYLRVA